MSFDERAVTFDCVGQPLLGIVSLPANPGALGVVIVVGGPQYRAGSHRQFVSLARRLAGSGISVLRFDYRGMGDSEGDLRNFEDIDADIDAAVGALCSGAPAVQRVVLWGLCDAAAAAMMYWERTRDPRIAGICALNPWVRSQVSLARTHVKHYYLARLRQRQFWTKLLSGRVAWSALGGLARNVRDATARRSRGPAPAQFQSRMARTWRDFDGHLLLLLSEDDYTAREFVEYTATDPEWQRALSSRSRPRVTLPGADHTCSTPGAKRAAEDATLDWLQSFDGGRPA